MGRKRIWLIAILILSLLPVSGSCYEKKCQADSGAGSNTSIVSVKTPICVKKSGVLWHRSFSKDSISYNSSPVFYGGKIYVVNKNILYELNKQGVILRQISLSASMNSVCYPAADGKCLYIPLDGGIMECVRITDMKSLWVSEAFGGQSLSGVCYYDGRVYAGTTKNPAGITTGIFYCLDVSDGHTVWTYEDTENPGGYYWSGAVVLNGILFFAGDNGILVSHSTEDNTVYDTRVLSENGKIRASLTVSESENVLYTTSNDSMVYRIETEKSGKISDVLKNPISKNIKVTNCTSTPVVYNGRLYVGNMADGYGYLNVMDAKTLALHYRVSTGLYKEVKSTPLISTAYANGNDSDTVYIYFTANAIPGGVYMIKDYQGAASSKLQSLFVPTNKQYCISSVFADGNKTLYYSNDSGHFFAVCELENPKKPSGIKVKKKKKKNQWTIRFQKRENDAKTQLYVRYASGKWKHLKTTAASRVTCRLKNKKKIQIRMRNKKEISSGRWLYSAYTDARRIR